VITRFNSFSNSSRPWDFSTTALTRKRPAMSRSRSPACVHTTNRNVGQFWRGFPVTEYFKPALIGESQVKNHQMRSRTFTFRNLFQQITRRPDSDFGLNFQP